MTPDSGDSTLVKARQLELPGLSLSSRKPIAQQISASSAPKWIPQPEIPALQLQNLKVQPQNRKMQLQNQKVQLQNRKMQLQNLKMQLRNLILQLHFPILQLHRLKVQLQKPDSAFGIEIRLGMEARTQNHACRGEIFPNFWQTPKFGGE